jgi:hypothetical protein
MKTTVAVFGALLVALSLPAIAGAEGLHYSSAEGSSVRVDGTSTLHDWTAKGGQIDGSIDFQVQGVKPGASREEIKRAIIATPKASADVAIPSRTLKSGNKDMDAKMYEALKTKKNPEIKYTLTDVGAVRDAGPDRFVFDTKGELTIAGTTRTLQMPMTVEILDEKRLRIAGKTAMKMSDFNVPRPQAMGGMIKSGDRVEVAVQWVVSQ